VIPVLPLSYALLLDPSRINDIARGCENQEETVSIAKQPRLRFSSSIPIPTEASATPRGNTAPIALSRPTILRGRNRSLNRYHPQVKRFAIRHFAPVHRPFGAKCAHGFLLRCFEESIPHSGKRTLFSAPRRVSTIEAIEGRVDCCWSVRHQSGMRRFGRQYTRLTHAIVFRRYLGREKQS